MDTEREKLSAVLKEPDEDAPRLDYASWCDQETDPLIQARGDFIRTQLALAGLGTKTPASQEYSLRYASEKGERTHGAAWAADIAPLVKHLRYDRGFVELVGLSAQDFLQRADVLFTLAPIRHLDLTNVVGVAQALFASPHLQTIRSLNLERCGLTDSEVALLASSPYLSELRWLSLAENRVGMAGADALATSRGLPRLAYVRFFKNPVEPNDQYSYDSGLVVDSWLPEDGLDLERRHGHLRWLHHDARSIADSVPDRFRIG